MGRNKDLRKKIAGCQAMILKHEEKIRAELVKDYADESLIASWQREVRAWSETIARLTRRLRRDW